VATITGQITTHIQDAYGITGTAPVFVTIDDSKTIAQLVTDALAFEGEVQGLSQGTVTKTLVTINAHIVSDPSLGTGDIEKGGLFNFENASDPYLQGYLIPDLAPTVLNSSGLIDLTNVNVSSFVTWMTAAHTVVQVVTKGVRALTALKDALIAFRKHRKPLARKTKEVA
jgi:hypothetical protein